MGFIVFKFSNNMHAILKEISIGNKDSKSL